RGVSPESERDGHCRGAASPCDQHAEAAVPALGGVLEAGVLPLVVSGRNMEGLRGQARALREWIAADQSTSLADVGLSLAVSRSALEERAVLVGGGRESLLAGLGELTLGQDAPGLVRGSTRAAAGALAFLFTGQGAQRPGMGRELHETLPVFAAAFDEACGYFDALLGCSLRAVVFGQTRAAGAAGGESLDDTAFAQAGLFALEVALFRLLEEWGVRPDYLIGHSIGELAAAHVAGVLSLADACALVAARGRLMSELPAGGAMVAVQASEQEALALLAGRERGAALAAVNAPAAVVISGDEEVVLELAGVFKERGHRTKRLAVSYAFHSPRMDAMLAELEEVAAGLSFAPARIPIVSNLTGEPLLPEQSCDPAYWARHAREPVHFLRSVRWLGGRGVRHLLELGPDGVLSAMARECLAGAESGRADGHAPSGWGPGGEGEREGRGAAAEAGDSTAEDPGAAGGGEHGASGVLAVPVLRGRRPQVRALVSALAQLWVRGVEVDWSSAFAHTGARRVRLPTYAFQRRRHWLEPAPRMLMSAGAPGGGGHPLLDSVLPLADGGWLCTGSLSLARAPWLAEHVLRETVLVPGTTHAEIAQHIARAVGCEIVRELVMEEPVVLAGHEQVALQVAVAAPDERGRRELAIHTCRAWGEPAHEAEQPGERVWTRNVIGVLASPAESGEGRAALGRSADVLDGAWPPAGAEALPAERLHETMAAIGFKYGPAFRSVSAIWRRGEELFAEVQLPAEYRAQARAFGVHPALLDSALQLGALHGDGLRETVIPFAWTGLSARAADACELRIRVCPTTPAGGMSLHAFDERGEPVLALDSLVAREVRRERLEQLRTGGERSLLRVAWEPLAATAERGLAVSMETLVVDEGSADRSPLDQDAERAADAVSACASGVLGQIQEWLARGEGESKLAVVTCGAVAVGAADQLPGLEQAAVWGLVRTAQSEHPGRFVLVDLDQEERSRHALPAALDEAVRTGEPQLAIRAGTMLVPRLRALGSPAVWGRAAEPQSRFDAESTVLITGGTGGLGALLARHLVGAQGVRHLLLASRRGERAPGARKLAAELRSLGASVRIVACDVAARGQLRELLASISGEHPLRAVVHAAGVLDDGVIDSLTPERLERVLAPKAGAALLLDELTAQLPLSAFVLFSSVAGTFGAPGQGNYAAANALLDALAARRRARGLPAIAIAWGPWQAEGMADRLGESELARNARVGVLPLIPAEGLSCFDAADAQGEAQLLAVRLDAGALRTQAAAGLLPPIMRGVVRVPARAAAERGLLRRRVKDTPHHLRAQLVLEVVCAEAAGVLGYDSAGAIETRLTFKELGFDSLAAVEFRNRLQLATELTLPATLIFDHPTPPALADRLLAELDDGSLASAPHDPLERELDELERGLAALPADDPRRARAVRRLQTILSGAGERQAAPEQAELARMMSAASAEEVFEFIDKQLHGANGGDDG
ncbi:MAG TPA: SDR family NAD(P)-dependent oxidoreductase, partial [Solirubrobacteraceae bacterium]|nr:SDR family NAD(P)-dependent oxidoreductase [Solirubrobacteraceae bacterium]